MKILKYIITKIRRKVKNLNYRLCSSESRLLRAFPFTSPHAAIIELSTVCNLKCRLCPVGRNSMDRPAEFMDPALFKKIVDDLNPWFVSLIHPAMWGESLLHPQFIELMEYIRDKDLDYQVQISTNGNIASNSIDFNRLINSGITEFLVALDAQDEEAYAQYRVNGNFNKLVTFVKLLREARDRANSNAVITGLVVLNRFNEQQQEEIKTVFGSHVDGLRFSPMRIFMDHKEKDCVRNDFKELQPLSPDLRHKPDGIHKNPICYSMRQDIYVNVKGHMIACCGDPKCRYDFGSLAKVTPYELRRTKQFKKMLSMTLNDPCSLPQCKSCLFDS